MFEKECLKTLKVVFFNSKNKNQALENAYFQVYHCTLKMLEKRLYDVLPFIKLVILFCYCCIRSRCRPNKLVIITECRAIGLGLDLALSYLRQLWNNADPMIRLNGLHSIILHHSVTDCRDLKTYIFD